MNGYYPLGLLPEYSIEQYSRWLTSSKDAQLALLDDSYLGEQLKKYQYQVRTSEDERDKRPWYRGVVHHPSEGFINNFDSIFPDVARALSDLSLENMTVLMQITPGSLITNHTQHFDANCGEDRSYRAYLVLDSKPRLFFRKLKSSYVSFYRNARGRYLEVPEHHCIEGKIYAKTLSIPHMWAINNDMPHGFDYEGNTGRVSLVIYGNRKS
jgi:hypothetical protein